VGASRICLRGSSHVFGNNANRLPVLRPWTELQNLGVFFKHRYVPGFEVVDIACFEHHLAILALDANLTRR